MEEKEKFYDKVLTEGARWMWVMRKTRPYINALGVKQVALNDLSYGFLAIARIYNVYGGVFCFKGNIFTFLYLKYIKGFKFLKRPSKYSVEYINIGDFCGELSEYFESTPTLIKEIYKYYY